MKILIGIPAYNEEATIAAVLEHTRRVVPEYDIVVVNDGSTDNTADKVRQAGVRLLNLPCNLGYSNAIQTILRYALQCHYDTVVFLDGDGQHNPDYLPELLAHFQTIGCDVLIGSRYIATKSYQGNPIGRRIGMVLFSNITKFLLKKRIYDTTSGMKVIKSTVIPSLLAWHFIDYSTEAIVYLTRLGFTIDEYPITVREREHGASMHSLSSHITYPITMLFLLVVTLIQSSLYENRHKGGTL